MSDVEPKDYVAVPAFLELEPKPLAIVHPPGSLIEVIARASTDPTVNVDKLERLMFMAERLEAKSAKDAYSAAMSDCQAEMKPIAQDADNPSTKSKYASYVALDVALRPIYTKHGFSISYTTADAKTPETVRVVARVKHRAGHEEKHRLDIPADGKGAKGGDVMTKTHAAMSAVSYGRRGLLKMIFNLAEGKDVDDDGAGGPVNEEQLAIIKQLIADTDSELASILAWCGVDALEKIPAKNFGKVERGLLGKKALMPTKAAAK